MVKGALWMIGTTITGTIGWFAGSLVGGVMTSWIFSVVGTAIGAWYVGKWVRENLP